jgi:error-prone DNA polymerase
MTVTELTIADLWATGTSLAGHPIGHLRADLDAAGVIPADQLSALPHGTNLHVAGLVTHRQRPPTAGGVCFLNLEDETGMINIICPPALWNRERRTAIDHAALRVWGRLERADGAINVLAYGSPRSPPLLQARCRVRVSVTKSVLGDHSETNSAFR